MAYWGCYYRPRTIDPERDQPRLRPCHRNSNDKAGLAQILSVRFVVRNPAIDRDALDLWPLRAVLLAIGATFKRGLLKPHIPVFLFLAVLAIEAPANTPPKIITLAVDGDTYRIPANYFLLPPSIDEKREPPTVNFYLDVLLPDLIPLPLPFSSDKRTYIRNEFQHSMVRIHVWSHGAGLTMGMLGKSYVGEVPAQFDAAKENTAREAPKGLMHKDHWINYGTIIHDDVYFHPSIRGDLFLMVCRQRNSRCEIFTRPTDRLQIKYDFTKQNAPRWKEIDQKVQSLLEEFRGR